MWRTIAGTVRPRRFSPLNGIDSDSTIEYVPATCRRSASATGAFVSASFAETGMSLKLIVFDVAGTTVCDDDNAVAGRLCDALQAAGAAITLADVDPVMGMPKPLAVRMLLEQARGQAPADDEVARIHADFQARIVAHYRDADTVKPAPGAVELFAALRERGILIALDTGFDRRTLDTIIARLGWQTLIDDSVTSDEVQRGRPYPDMIEAAMAQAGVAEPAVVGKVGDSASDIEQGINAGCGLVAAIMNARTRAVIDRYPTVHQVTHLNELLPLVDQVAAGARS